MNGLLAEKNYVWAKKQTTRNYSGVFTGVDLRIDPPPLFFLFIIFNLSIKYTPYTYTSKFKYFFLNFDMFLIHRVGFV